MMASAQSTMRASSAGQGMVGTVGLRYGGAAARDAPGRVLLLVTLSVLFAAGCSPAATPEPTPEPTPTIDAQVASYVRTFGGQESQYRAILTSLPCENLARLDQMQFQKMDQHDELGPDSPEWRQALGYSNAIGQREAQLDC